MRLRIISYSAKVDRTMTEEIRPHPKNVSGPFYVEYGCCTSCDVPIQEAPSHFAYDTDNHCFVCRQPQTDAETSDMIGTAWMAEFQCIRYRGNDLDVLRRLAELDLRVICDTAPPPNIDPVIRNHVQINVVGAPVIATPKELAQEFVDHVTAQNNEWRRFKARPIQTFNDYASLKFSWYDDHFHLISFTIGPDAPHDWHIEYPLKNDLGDRGVGNVVSFWLKSHQNRFVNHRWFTDANWSDRKSWQSTPW